MPTVAVIGGGVSGIGAAKVLKQNGYDVIIYERNSCPGGIWSIGYQDVQIQSYNFQYHYCDFSWPDTIPCTQHPTAKHVLQYLEATIQHYELNIKYNHTIISMEERNDGWIICISNQLGKILRKFDYVIVSSGLFTDGKYRPVFPGQDVSCFISILILFHIYLTLPYLYPISSPPSLPPSRYFKERY